MDLIHISLQNNLFRLLPVYSFDLYNCSLSNFDVKLNPQIYSNFTILQHKDNYGYNYIHTPSISNRNKCGQYILGLLLRICSVLALTRLDFFYVKFVRGKAAGLKNKNAVNAYADCE